MALACAVAAFVATAVPTRIGVSTEGMLVEWFGWRRFYSRQQIENVESFEEGFGRARRRGVVLILKDGSRSKLYLEQGDVHRVRQAISKTFGLAGAEVVPAATAIALSRGSSSHRDWVLRLRAVGAQETDRMRTSAVTHEALWSVIENAEAPPTDRAAAVVALRASLDDNGTQRLRDISTTTLDPSLRAVFDHAGGPVEDAEMEQALIDLEEEDKRRAQ